MYTDKTRSTKKSRYSQKTFEAQIGKWSEFRTPWGTHRGIVEKVQSDWVLFKLPKEDAPKWAKNARHINAGAESLDLVLTGGFFNDGFGFDNKFRHDDFDCHRRRHHDIFPCWFSGSWCFIFIPIIFVLFFSFFCW